MSYDRMFKVGGRIIGAGQPTYFIADIGANHDGLLTRAKGLIKLAAEAGADCVKFQHFQAARIVSAKGFSNLQIAHQAGWQKSVYETYEDYSINREWTIELAQTAKDCGVWFMTTPYDLEAIHQVEPYVPAFKIGSGDITYMPLIEEVASMGKPTFMATGASTMAEVEAAVGWYLERNPKLCLMQCNTNYTGDPLNVCHTNLNVLKTYATRWPGMPLGLSDHTPSDVTALGAIALGACVIEKHFTDDTTRKGPDHAFAITPGLWMVMQMHARQMQEAMGDGFKTVEANELESRVVQRRAIRLKRDLVAGAVITAGDLDFLRPCPEGALTPAEVSNVIDRSVTHDMVQGCELYPRDLI
jgi:N-acetylneuraminate synthase